MTRTEAVKILQDTPIKILSIKPFINMRYVAARDMAIIALQEEEHLVELEAKAVEVIKSERHGEWKVVPSTSGGYHDFRCSECRKFRFHNGEMIKKYHYCPNCGAKMDGGKDGR